MEITREDLSDAGAAAVNSRTAAIMLAVVIVTCLSLLAMAETPWVKDTIRETAWKQATRKKQIPLFSFYREFLDSEDRLIHEDLPSLDFTRGGIYLIGASNVAWAVKLWDLPADVRPWFHNLAMKGTNQSDQFDMLRFLVEQRRQAGKEGGSKTLVVFGLSYHSSHNARISQTEVAGSLSSVLERHGFYSINPDGTIRRNARPRLYETIVLERTKITGVLKELVNLVYTPFKLVRTLDPKGSADEWRRTLGDRWNEKIDHEVNVFSRSVAFLRERGVRTVVVQMPQPSWDHDTPFEKAFMRGIRKVCQDQAIPVYDFSRLVLDDEFADSVHLTTEGMAKFGTKIVEIGREFLYSTGVRAPSQSATNP